MRSGVRLTDPSYLDFSATIAQISQGIIQQLWIDRAWDAMGLWPEGNLKSNPYGKPVAMALVVRWAWDDGNLKVTIERA